MPVSISFGYKTINQPWGGANSFLRALQLEIAGDPDFSIVAGDTATLDILFLNEISSGRGGGEPWTLRGIRDRHLKPDRPRLVVRAVNLRRHTGRSSVRSWLGDRIHDRTVISLLNMADLVIYQSDYQKYFFTAAGVDNPNWKRIHNGASRDFRFCGRRSLAQDGPLRLVSATFSPRTSKNHEIIARMADFPGVVVQHFGNWPAALPAGKVQLMGVHPHAVMAAAYAEAHAFLHPAIKDPCPNAVFEAASTGLPVIYNNGPGSSAEILGDGGIALDSERPEAAVHELRQQYDAFAAAVERRLAYFSIERAASEYKSAFRYMAENRNM